MNEKIEKSQVKFVPRLATQYQSNWWLAEIQIDGKPAGWLNWIEACNGVICTVSASSSFPMGRKIATDEKTAQEICEALQQKFENNEIGWPNVNLGRTG